MSEEYTVGIICALAFEQAAVIAMLDEEYPGPEDQDENDNNSYRYGRLHQHKVAIASLPKGIYGTNAAAIVATNMKRMFKNLKFGLLVGIGGAAPLPSSEEQDIRLGDVVVGKPAGNYGGLIQLDYGKVTQEDGLVRKGNLPPPPFALLTALNRLEGDQELGETTLAENLEAMFTKRPAMKKRFRFPGTENDVLYEPRYIHPKSAATCESCDAARQVAREERESNEPVIFSGTIGSSNTVMKDALTRDQIREELGVMCFEMEAAGLLDFPCIVIRGVSDYSDSHKNDRWQRYAAATAAACAKSLLEYVSPVSVLKEQPIREAFREQTQTIIKAVENNRQSDVKSQCLQFFDVLPYKVYKDANPDRAPGTCSWVFDHPRYQDWISSPRHNFLWISADPGCGKSVLAKALVDEVLPRDSTICYFFFKDNEHQEDISMALCCLLHQLFSHVPDLISYALPAWEKRKKTLKKDQNELWSLFLEVTADERAGNVVCIFDALDECSGSGRKKLMGYLKSIYAKDLQTKTKRKSSLKFLATSRPHFDIESELNELVDLPMINQSKDAESSKVRAEIDTVIKSKLESMMLRLGLDHDVREELESRVIAMENRTYLWIDLFMDDLQYRVQRGEKLRARDFEQLPLSVEAAYERLLDRHTENFRNRRDAFILLHLIVGARRPMHIKEMDVAFNLALQNTEGSMVHELDRDFLDGNRLPTRIRALCGLLVSIIDDRVYLIHQTAKEFLLQKNSKVEKFSQLLTEGVDSRNTKTNWKASVHAPVYTFLWAHIAISCLLILDFESKAVVTVHGDRGQVQALFMYAATYWGDYFRGLSPVQQSLLQVPVMRLYEAAYSGSSMWFDFYQKEHFNWPNYRARPTMLSLACLLGHRSSVELLLPEQDHGLPKADWHSSPSQIDPFIAAIRSGHLGTVKLFLKRDEVEPGGQLYGVAILLCSFNGEGIILKELLDNESRIGRTEKEDGFYIGTVQFALVIATRFGHIEIAKMLSAQRPVMNPVLNEVLEQAAVFKQNEIFWILMNREKDPPDSEKERQQSLDYSLRTALMNDNIELGRDLLRKGASANGVNKPRKKTQGLMGEAAKRIFHSHDLLGSSMHRNIIRESWDAVGKQVLGNWFTSVLYHHVPPLVRAALLKNTECVSLLIEHGADLNIECNAPITGLRSKTALGIALEKGHREIAILLLKEGANVRSILRYRKEPCQGTLRLAIHEMIHQGFRIEKVGKHIYVNAVKIAKRFDCEDIVAAFRQHEPSVTDNDLGIVRLNLPDPHDGRQLANMADGMTRQVIVPDMNMPVFGRDTEGTSSKPPLADIISQSKNCDIRLLIGDDFDPNERGKHYSKIPLHWVAERGQVEEVELLLGKGSDPNTLDHFGQTALHYAAERGHEEVVRHLLPVTDALIIDTKGRTAWKCAKDNHHSNIVEMLDPFHLVEEWEVVRLHSTT